ncbi:MAG: sodium-translocating pyrophosphatase, partial [Spirochaetota bacterium]
MSKRLRLALVALIGILGLPTFASEADLLVPKIEGDSFTLLLIGLGICVLGLVFGLVQFVQVKGYKVHESMRAVGEKIFGTCKAYLIQQGKFLIVLEVFIALCLVFYFGFLKAESAGNVVIILLFSIIGILGSYGVAWYGIRMNTFANARTAFASLEGKRLPVLSIPLQSGMSIGVMLVSIELIVMLFILMYIPGNIAGYCFLGFAIGESLGASALRVAGGIFTKIADIGSDLMKIVFKVEEDDPRNPGVIADCTGDNAGDSVGPTADGFETYGVTGVALITFILLGVANSTNQITLLTWIFVMRVLMIITSVASYWINGAITRVVYGKQTHMDFERPLSNLIWISSILSIVMTFAVSYWQLSSLEGNLWLVLSVIISCGTLGAALIPEFTKIFTSTKSAHTKEVVTASREGGASLTILSGLVSGNFSAFWIGLVIMALMAVSYFASTYIPGIMVYPSVFAFGLVAFGFLGMGPVTIAVDSYGPVTDNAQSVYELSRIEQIPGIEKEIEKDFGFKPNFTVAKEALEENDGAGNTFKATAKPVLIGTAVVGATTMIFSLILLIEKSFGINPTTILNILNPYSLLGFIAGGSVIYWFSGASMQAVTTGAYSAVEFIKKNFNVNSKEAASDKDSEEVVRICTVYAQKGMYNIFLAVFCFALAFAFFSAPSGFVNGTTPADSPLLRPMSFFVFYLIAIAVFGLFQAVFMANAGGCWDNAKKIVETDKDLKAAGEGKGLPLHSATLIGD